MIIKNYINKIADFTLRRLAELTGLFLIIISILLLISLATYSPQDPTFIFPENQEIRNILGVRGSFVADIFFQSVGLISFLVPISFFFTGVSIVINKNLIVIIENIFFIIIYILLATLFFSIFYKESYWLIINDNNGFVGNLLSETIFIDLLNINKTFSYYLLIFFIFLFFLLSSSFKIIHIYSFFNFIKKLFLSKKKRCGQR